MSKPLWAQQELRQVQRFALKQPNDLSIAVSPSLATVSRVSLELEDRDLDAVDLALEKIVDARNRIEQSLVQKMKMADGIILGSPVYFSGVAGTMKSFLDRAFFVSTANKGLYRHKVGASVAAVRRSGGLPTVNTLNHYITYSEMILATSNYWNVAHGTMPGEMEQDGEGKQIMEVLGRNMAWIMKTMEYGKKEIPAPDPVAKTMTNFIR